MALTALKEYGNYNSRHQVNADPHLPERGLGVDEPMLRRFRPPRHATSAR
jgi:hypothetical protein